MSTVVEHRDGATEREASAHQRNLVDTCFEEGQFEAAIALMDQLRSPYYKPPISHIRQLIYISLQSAAPSLTGDALPPGDTPASPSKTSLKNKTRIPSRAAVEGAQRLLMSFALTNVPATIAAALPSYDDTGNSDFVPDKELAESIIGLETMAIQRSKSCWHILAEGFMNQKRNIGFGSPGKRRRTYSYSDGEDDANPLMEEDVVGENAWPVLDWLLVLFDQDEVLTANRQTGRYSHLLLQQVPRPRTGSDMKWDTEIPLSIVFHCLKQEEFSRRMMGCRLMTMLINLCYADQLDTSRFISSTFSKIAATEMDKLPALLTGLGPSPANHVFKVALCQKFLADVGTSREERPKPQFRAQPRALRSSRTEPSLESIKPLSAVGSSRNALPQYSVIKQLSETKPLSSSVRIPISLLLRIKFELINSYGVLQSCKPLARRDTSWLTALENGDFKRTLAMAFDPQIDVEKTGYREILEVISTTWR